MKPQPPAPPPKHRKPSSATATAVRETTPEMDDIYDKPSECATVSPAKVTRDHYYSYAELQEKNSGLPSQPQVSPPPMASIDELKRLRAATLHGPPAHSTQTVTGRLSHDESRPHPLPLPKHSTLPVTRKFINSIILSACCVCVSKFHIANVVYSETQLSQQQQKVRGQQLHLSDLQRRQSSLCK